MRHKKLEISALAVQLVYGVLCLLDMVLCFVYLRHYDSSFGACLAYFLLDFTCILFFLPAMPVGFVLNLCVLRKRRLADIPRGGWIIYTILSPIVYILCFLPALAAFMASTGGV